MPITDVALLAAAVFVAAAGGELFLKGVLGVSDALRVPKMLAATTLAAFATSSPELTVSTIAAIAGEPAIGLGDALGSNVVNVALIFGLALLYGPIRVSRTELGSNYVLALVTPLLTLWLASDGVLSRVDGVFLLLIFAAWLVIAVRSGFGYRQKTNGVFEEDHAIARTVVYVIGGLAALILAGRLFVAGATGIASAMGVHAYVVGATVVAIGTSLPELVTVVFSRLRGHDDVGVGTLIGSNLFNGLAIVGTAASIHPIHVSVAEVSVALVLGTVALAMLLPDRTGSIGRFRGVVLLATYVGFVIATSVVGGNASP
jgi:cation:H+ antiporter